MAISISNLTYGTLGTSSATSTSTAAISPIAGNILLASFEVFISGLTPPAPAPTGCVDANGWVLVKTVADAANQRAVYLYRGVAVAGSSPVTFTTNATAEQQFWSIEQV